MTTRVTQLDTPEWHRLCGYVEALNHHIDSMGANLVISFELDAFQIYPPEPDPQSLVRLAEPEMASCDLEIRPSSGDLLQADIVRVIEVTRQPWSAPDVWRTLQRKTYDGLLSCLSAAVDWRGAEADVYSYHYTGTNLLR